MFETLTNLNLIKLLTTTDQLSIKHSSGNDKLAADVEEAVQELVEDYGDLAEQYSYLKVENGELNDDMIHAEIHISTLEALLKHNGIEFQKYFETLI